MSEAKRVERPLSPHLQIYRWHIPMLTSILTRVTGHALVAGVLLAVAWLLSATISDEAFETMNGIVTCWFGDLVFTRATSTLLITTVAIVVVAAVLSRSVVVVVAVCAWQAFKSRSDAEDD